MACCAASPNGPYVHATGIDRPETYQRTRAHRHSKRTCQSLKGSKAQRPQISLFRSARVTVHPRTES
ncbi:uncharacterized protein PHACADRAFT_262447 [Phanerochaete carnosa HHB-10118-sp]|uniref:Uncharacterized protein n=1 Tax=Phanerochaete carnosa (strain HHB-10118-sp) TaxID=650164 RepID=K5VZF2_PHACS|nr:uncharacterized protein PHACADRAFT_262447 [Phanerochaete carnosa HHB-10118-sp]EKM51994.1 hypothetical protein PHACADRAFT_262447 [Phanerochaete carnosa HHB-10118-sp]